MTEARLHTRQAEGVEMWIAIDSTVRGPALGGCRWKTYPSLDDARRDVCALARAMTRKAALARLALGGGKAVVLGDPRTRTREQLLALGDFVESLGGEYITAADMGTGEAEMAVIAERTRHVTGLARSRGGGGGPGPFTARGVLLALRVALQHRDRSLHEARVAIQGMGSVGRGLAELLLDEGASVVAADPNPGTHDLVGIDWVEPEAIYAEPCDVFAPCGPSAGIDEGVAARLACQVICGGANNPLVGSAMQVLDQRGILYVPDFLANAGGLIHLAVALEGGDEAASLRHLEVIPENLEAVIRQAKSDHADTASTAIRMADTLVVS